MKNLKLDAQQVQDELTELTQNLRKSQLTLNSLPDIDVASTPSHCIYKRDKLSLLYFESTQPKEDRASHPIFICYALVNRWYMIDLDPKRSLLRSLLARGLDVYVLDWGYPDKADRFLDLDDYINDYLDDCIDQALAHSGSTELDLMGICQGGTFSLCYTALHSKKVRKLITAVTPVNFQTPDNMLQKLSQHTDIDLAVKTYGNIPGSFLNHVYSSLMPMRLGIQKNLNLPKHLTTTESALSYLRMEKWLYDCPDQAGEAFKEFITLFFRENRFVNGGLTIGGTDVNLCEIRHPILNIYGQHDHLVPADSSLALKAVCPHSQYSELLVKAGHIGVFVSRKAHKLVPDTIVKWLAE